MDQAEDLANDLKRMLLIFLTAFNKLILQIESEISDFKFLYHSSRWVYFLLGISFFIREASKRLTTQCK